MKTNTKELVIPVT